MVNLFEPFLILFIAHLIGDFVLQTEQMAFKKGNELCWLGLHALELGTITWILCWTWQAWPIVIVVFLTHLVFDAIKPRLPGSILKWYIWDQVGHLIILWICAYLMVAWFNLKSMPLTYYIPLNVQVVIAAYLLVGRPVTVGVALFLKPWQDEAIKSNDKEAASPSTGLTRSGEWIGNLERFLTLSCVLLEQYLPILGILIAKAVLRFNPNLSGATRRICMDYFLIGTIASIGFAIAVGGFTRWVIDNLIFLVY